MPFEVIPAIDLRGGRCVQLVQGRKEREIISLQNPVDVARRWVEEGATRLHIIDLDGAFQEERRNIGIIGEIGKYDVPIQVGGGIRSYEDAVKLLDMGVDRVIVGTAAIKNKTLVRRLSDEFSAESVMVAMDVKSGEVMIDGWRCSSRIRSIDLASEFEDNIGCILFTNIDVEGLVRGIRIEPIKEIVNSTRVPVIVSGGVSSLKDIVEIKDIGAEGVVIGTALYNGKITLRDAMEAINEL